MVKGRRHGGGRRYDPHARRRHTTRAGRRGAFLPPDRGSSQLRAKKRRITGSEAVELTAAGILFGHGYLDNAQYSALGYVTHLLQKIARGFGRGASPAGVWSAIVAAASRTTPGMPDIAGDFGARRALEHTLRRLDGSRDLVLELASEGALPPICVRAAERSLTPRDLVRIELLKKALDGISLPRGRAEAC